MLEGGYSVRFDTELRKNVDPPVQYSSYWGYLEGSNGRNSLGIGDMAGVCYLDRSEHYAPYHLGSPDRWGMTKEH